MRKEYKILKNTSTQVLEAEISVHLSGGWSPVGGISAALLRYDRDGQHILEYAQAIERETLPILAPEAANQKAIKRR